MGAVVGSMARHGVGTRGVGPAGTLRLALRRTSGLPAPDHDDQLRELLEQAITDCRSLLSPPHDRTARPPCLPPVTSGSAALAANQGHS